jgi:hypothetical protein
MFLEAILTKADLETVLRQFSPLKILLGDNGSLLLAEVKDVSFVPDEGIEVVCDGALHWPVLGFDMPVTFNGLALRVLPVVDTAAKGTPLVFRLQLNHTGLAVLPSMFDHRVTTLINDEFQKKHVELSWNFIKTLTHEFALPAAIASAAAISLVAVEGVVKANSRALGLAVRFETTVRRRLETAEDAAKASVPATDEAEAKAAEPPPPALPRPLPEAFDVRSFVVGGAVAAAAFTTLGGIARLFSRNRHHRSW